METFRKLAQENKKLTIFLAALVGLGAVFLLVGRLVPEPEEYLRDVFYGSAEIPPPTEIPPERADFSQERAIEARLEEFFSLVEGAGQVRVMVSPLGTRETVFATDTNETRAQTTEQDSAGGTRETRNYQLNEKTVIIHDRQGTDRPLILREIEPRIEGIVIITEGGDCPFVRDALTRAARAVLGLDAHLVQVLTMQR